MQCMLRRGERQYYQYFRLSGSCRGSASGWGVRSWQGNIRYVGVMVSITSACGCLGAVGAPLVAGVFLHCKVMYVTPE